MKKVGLTLVCGVLALLLCVSPAFALPAFNKQFQARYATDTGNADFEAAVKKAGCNVCHVKGKDKEERNAYGDFLAELIEGDAKARLAAAKEKGEDAEKAEQETLSKELEEALTKVEEMKAASGETFGAILKAHKLPVPVE